MNVEIMSTLWPDMAHYKFFAEHPLISGIRLNTAMADDAVMVRDMDQAVAQSHGTKLYFDVKGRQLRVTKVYDNKDRLEIDINHPISVPTPTEVLFKAGADFALLSEVKDGTHLIFEGGPSYTLKEGESLNIRNPELKVLGPCFTDQQLKFIDIAKRAGIRRYMLSYVTEMSEIEELKSMVGDREIIAKIESPKGLDFAERAILPKNVHFMAARGDLFVEVAKPHDILSACKMLVKRDPETILGSRILLSLSPIRDATGKIVEATIPSCSDINEIAWLLSVGYKRFMFCDGLCLHKDALENAVNVLYAIARDYS